MCGVGLRFLHRPEALWGGGTNFQGLGTITANAPNVKCGWVIIEREGGKESAKKIAARPNPRGMPEVGDGNAQPEEQPEGDGIWSTNQKVKNYGQHLALQVSVGFCIDPAEGVEPVINVKHEEFPGRIIVQEPTTAILEAKKDESDLVLWSDGSKLQSGKVSIAVVWKNTLFHGWKSCKMALGKNKEVLDAELWGISEAVGGWL